MGHGYYLTYEFSYSFATRHYLRGSPWKNQAVSGRVNYFWDSQIIDLS